MLRARKRAAAAVVILLLTSFAGRPSAAQANAEMEALRQELQELRRRDAERQRQIDRLEQQLERLQGAEPNPAPAAVEAPAATTVAPPVKDEAAAALDKALEESTPAHASRAPAADLWSRQVGGSKLRLIDLSFDTMVAGGTSTADNGEISQLQGGGHDPQRRGFTLQQAELSLMGAVDPYLTGEAHIVFTPDGVELEEALMTTSSLPYGLQIEAGYFLTEFGQINPLHPHAWDWIDQPLIATRMFGEDGLRAPGFRLGWLTPLPWFSELHFGMQNADEGETTASFISEEAIGGRPALERSVHALEDLLYLARWESFLNLSETVGIKFGASGLYGPNATGADGETFVYGADSKLRWRPQDNFRGWPFLVWQTEVIKRDYTAASFAADPGDPDAGAATMLERAILRDWGLYTQVLYGFRYSWAAGARFEYASGHSPSVGGRQNDALRDDRYRVSPLLVWHPSELSRLRLQYNYDNARHLSERDAHSFWLGAEVLYGMHPAHKY